ncbi:MAG TPA: 6-carboxytetrahydropterin synthase QueD [Kofleriaceae bacterium]|nr:6-carboxytetrahydropterin synthase QueD [Kofleriaceae bacterium]
MPTRIVREYHFEAAHFLPRVVPGHKCARMHGHSYRVVVTVEGEVDPHHGWVMDFGDLDGHVVPLIDSLDHRLLNELPGLDNPTSELLAAWMWQRIKPHVPMLAELEVSETPSSRCVYRGT